jgi:PRTRC genetic system protein C
MSSIQIPKRAFRSGAQELPDPTPDGSMSPDQVRGFYAENFPHLAMATISDPVLEGDVLVYTFEAPEAKTKG